MSKIISFGNQKGGVGKSTITCMCANAFAAPPFNYKVCVIDNDQQQSIYEARSFDIVDDAVNPPYPVWSMNTDELIKSIRSLDEAYDLIFIDTPGKLDVQMPAIQQEVTKTLAYCDYLFIPFKGGSFNLDATLQYLQFLLKLQEKRAGSARPLNIWGFINMYRQRSRVHRHLVHEVRHLKDNGLPFMINRLGNYTIFEEVDTLTGYYDEDTNDTGKLNFTVWLNELHKILNHD